MKKKISLLGLVLILVLSLAGCGSAKEAATYDEAALQQQAMMVMSVFEGESEDTLNEIYNMNDFSIDTIMFNTGLKLEADAFRGMWEAWQANKNECGTLVDFNWTNTEVTSDGVKLIAEFEGETRSGTIEFAFNEKSYMESITFNANYELSEILTKAGLNTVLGMGTVFVVLIFISFIISLFGFIPAIEKKFKGGKNKETKAPAAAPAKPAAPAAKVPAPAAASAAANDAELVAVIAAAIAAAEGTSTDGFIVRSIKRRKSNRWN